MATKRGSGHGYARSDRVRSRSGANWRICCASTSRTLRIAPKLTLVTLTAVEVTADYAHAKVFYTSLADPASNEMIDQGLKHSASFLRRELGRRIRIHHIPELHFVFDPSVQEGPACRN
jgi:ribosome-binding factor A